MASGTVNDPSKGYHLEIVCASQTLANDLKKLINSFVDLSVKVVERKKNYAVYMKSSSYISDMLAIMGASHQVLEFENTMIKKNIMNETVRITNCDNANMDRVLDAAERQISNIKLIEAKMGLDILPDKLREVAEKRLEHPEASLVQLGEMMDPPLKKSGINNRIKKLEEVAKKLAD